MNTTKMFSKKVNSLLANSAELNSFIKEGLKASYETTSGNGAVKYTTTGNEFVDNFALIANFKEPRSYEEITKDMQKLWSIDPISTLKLSVYIRLITRNTKLVVNNSTEELSSQRGQGLKHEGLMRFIWIAVNHPNTFKANIAIFIAAGSWKDVFKMLSIDLQYNGWDNRQLDWRFLYKVILSGLNNPDTTDLVRKYLPTIKNNKNCTTLDSQANTLIGRWIASNMFSSKEGENIYKKYRLLKSKGLAHQWQQKISKQLYNEINFNTIAGRALTLLVGSKFLENHNLIERYSKWISSKPVAKFTGFVFELFKPLGGDHTAIKLPDYQENTIQAQFNQLVQNTKVDSNLLVVRDISGSMTSTAKGTNMSSYAIGKAMALYFSETLKGPFENAYAVFSNKCELRVWKGSTVCDKWRNDRDSDFGSTNFVSVAKLLVNIKSKGIEESEFPNGILCISDGEFDGYGKVSNFVAFKNILKEGGFSEEFVNNFKIILWDLPNSWYGSSIRPKFEDFADAPNFFYMSGYDPAAVSFIFGNEYTKKEPKTAEELFEVAMDQELLNKLTIVSDNIVNTKHNLNKNTSKHKSNLK